MVGIEDSLDETAVDSDLSRVTEGTIFEVVLGDMEDKIAEGSIEMIIIGVMAIIEAEIGPER